MNESMDKSSRRFGGIIVVIALGFFVRLYACWATVIVPPDGTLYLYQAKMVFNGMWEHVTGCGISFLSNLPFFIAGAYWFFHDWVVAGQAVSLCFGTAMLVFVYCIVREFCDRETSLLSTLILAMTPVMVGRSADIIRGPVFWFFLSLGLYLVIVQWRRERFAGFLVFAAFAFVMAAWARIEGVILIPVSLFCLVLIPAKDRIRRCTYFSMPLLVLTAAFVLLYAVTGTNILTYFRGGEMVNKSTSFFSSYQLVREQLRAIAGPDTPEPLLWFLPEARRNAWLVGAGVLLNRICEGFFYPYLLFYLVGMVGVKSRVIHDKRLIYLFLLTVSVFVLLYLHSLQTWMLYYRSVIFAIIPASVFTAFGVEKIRNRLQQTLHLKPNTIMIGLSVLIILAGLPKNLALRDPEKAVFRDIGRRIAELETGHRRTSICSPKNLHRWISFYANLDVYDPPCPEPQPEQIDLWPLSAAQLTQSIHDMQQQGIGYYLWEQKSWSGSPFPLISKTVKKQLLLVGQWQHPDSGKLILFRLQPIRPDATE